MSSKKIADQVQKVHQALEQDNYTEQIQSLISTLHSAEIADLLESLPGKQRAEVWQLLPTEAVGDVLSHLEEDVRCDLLEQMTPNKVAEVTRRLDDDDAADILQDLPEDALASVLAFIDKFNRDRIASILAYPQDTAGGLMSTDVLPIRADVSLDVVKRYLHVLGEIPERTDNLVVVDRNNIYLGVLPLTTLLTCDAQLTVAEVMQRQEAVKAETPENIIAEIFEKLDLVSIAVINHQSQLVGRITVDDVIDVMQKQADQKMRNMAGIGESDLFAPVISSVRRRSVWLGINLLTAILAAGVISLFQDSIQAIVVLAVLMPIIAGMGGIAGSQTLTIAIRGIATGRLSKANMYSLLIKELNVGLLNSLLWASAMVLIIWLWFDAAGLAWVAAAAIAINLFLAAFAGAMIPFILDRFHIDPAVAGGVILTTVTDIIGFVSLLGLATILLL